MAHDRKRLWEQCFFTILEESDGGTIQEFTRSSLRREIKRRLNCRVNDKKSENQWLKEFINQYICSRNILVFLLIANKKHFIKNKPDEITLSLIHNILRKITPNELIGHKIIYEIFIGNAVIKSDKLLQKAIVSQFERGTFCLYINVEKLEYRKRTADINALTKRRKLISHLTTVPQDSEHIPSSASSIVQHESKTGGCFGTGRCETRILFETREFQKSVINFLNQIVNNQKKYRETLAKLNKHTTYVHKRIEQLEKKNIQLEQKLLEHEILANKKQKKLDKKIEDPLDIYKGININVQQNKTII